MIRAGTEFLKNLKQKDYFNATECFNCGTCTALCPMGIEILPRELFRYVLIGAEEKIVERSDTIFSCLLCKMCEVNCPQGVKIAENIRTLRWYLTERIYKIS